MLIIITAAISTGKSIDSLRPLTQQQLFKSPERSKAFITHKLKCTDVGSYRMLNQSIYNALLNARLIGEGHVQWCSVLYKINNPENAKQVLLYCIQLLHIYIISISYKGQLESEIQSMYCSRRENKLECI